MGEKTAIQHTTLWSQLKDVAALFGSKKKFPGALMWNWIQTAHIAQEPGWDTTLKKTIKKVDVKSLYKMNSDKFSLLDIRPHTQQYIGNKLHLA